MENEDLKFLDEIEKDAKKQLIRNIFDMQIDKKMLILLLQQVLEVF